MVVAISITVAAAVAEADKTVILTTDPLRADDEAPAKTLKP